METISPNIRQQVVAQLTAPSMTVQLEECSLEPGSVEFRTCYRQHVLTLVHSHSPHSKIWTRFDDSQDYVLHRNLGKLVFDPPDVQRHVYMPEPPAHQRSVSCYFDSAFFTQSTGLSSNWGPDSLSACVRIDGPLMMDAMQQLSREISAPGFASDILVDSIGRLLTVEIARYFHSLPPPRSSGYRRLPDLYIDRIHDYLNDIHGQKITIGLLAKLCDLSADHLRRAFRESTGKSIGAYVEEIRISKAKSLLDEHRMSIKQIAHYMGFANTNSFYVAFRRATGETPKAYKLKSRN